MHSGVNHDRENRVLLRSVVFFNTARRDRPRGTVSPCPLPAAPGAPAGGASPQLMA